MFDKFLHCTPEHKLNRAADRTARAIGAISAYATDRPALIEARLATLRDRVAQHNPAHPALQEPLTIGTGYDMLRNPHRQPEMPEQVPAADVALAGMPAAVSAEQ